MKMLLFKPESGENRLFRSQKSASEALGMGLAKIKNDPRFCVVEAIYAVKTSRRYCICRKDDEGRFWELLSNETVFGDAVKEISESMYTGRSVKRGHGKCCRLKGGGAVFSDGTVVGKLGEVLEPGKDGKVRVDGKMKKVADLVAEAFLECKLPGMDYVRHKDGDKGNNRVENLEWSFEPEEREVAMVRRSEADGRNPRVFRSVKAAAADRGVSVQAIYQFAHGNKKDSKGYIWSFII